MLIAAQGESARERIRLDALEEEGWRTFLIRRPAAPSAAQGGQRAADVGCDQFVDQRQAVPFVLAKRHQREDFGWVAGFVAVFIYAATRRQRFALADKLLHPAHRHHAGGPVDAT